MEGHHLSPSTHSLRTNLIGASKITHCVLLLKHSSEILSNWVRFCLMFFIKPTRETQHVRRRRSAIAADASAPSTILPPLEHSSPSSHLLPSSRRRSAAAGGASARSPKRGRRQDMLTATSSRPSHHRHEGRKEEEKAEEGSRESARSPLPAHLRERCLRSSSRAHAAAREGEQPYACLSPISERLTQRQYPSAHPFNLILPLSSTCYSPSICSLILCYPSVRPLISSAKQADIVV